MTKRTAVELAKILDGFADKANTRFHKKLDKITKFGDARDKYKSRLAVTGGLITLLSATDQKKLRDTWNKYLDVSALEDIETKKLIKRYNKLSNPRV